MSRICTIIVYSELGNVIPRLFVYLNSNSLPKRKILTSSQSNILNNLSSKSQASGAISPFQLKAKISLLRMLLFPSPPNMLITELNYNSLFSNSSNLFASFCRQLRIARRKLADLFFLVQRPLEANH